MKDVREIAEELNAMAGELAPELLRNGRRAGNKWMASGIADTGKSESLYVHLSGPKIGHWVDCGNAAAGEEKGDMLDLLRLKLGLPDAKAAVEEAKRRLGIEDRWTPHERPRPADPAEQQARVDAARERALKREAEAAEEVARMMKRAKGLFFSGVPVEGTPAERYLEARGLDGRSVDGAALSWPGSLRFHPEVWHSGEKLKFPALLAGIFNAGGEQVAIQRIYLQCEAGRWVNLRVSDRRKALGPSWGGFVPINKGSSGKSMRHMAPGEAVYVTEGVEDALALRMLRPAARIVAAVSLPNIGGIILPPAAKSLVICADRDPSEQAQEQLERAIAQQQARGLTVALVMPPEGLKDLNDWLLAWRRHDLREKRDGNEG